MAIIIWNNLYVSISNLQHSSNKCLIWWIHTSWRHTMFKWLTTLRFLRRYCMVHIYKGCNHYINIWIFCFYVSWTGKTLHLKDYITTILLFCSNSLLKLLQYLMVLLRHKMFVINCEVNILWNGLKKSNPCNKSFGIFLLR